MSILFVNIKERRYLLSHIDSPFFFSMNFHYIFVVFLRKCNPEILVLSE